MSTIPFSSVAQVNPSVLSAGGSAIDLNGLILTKNNVSPVGQLQSFSSAAAVATFFGASSVEAQMAATYFKGYDNCTNTPATLYFLYYAEAGTPAILTGGTLPALATAKAQTGAMQLTVNGTAYECSGVGFSAATSYNDIATELTLAFTQANSGGFPFTIAYNSALNALVFTTTTTGTSATIGFAVDYSGGAVADTLMLTSATGATLAQGVLSSPSAFMTNVINSITQNFASFATSWQSPLSELQAFASWTNSVAPRYWYVAVDADPNAKVTNNTTCFGYYLNSQKLSGTTAIYSPTSDLNKVAFAMSWAASLDFTRLNGRTDLCFRSQSGLTPDVTSVTDASNLEANGYNFYGAFGSNNPANNQNWFSDGAVSGQWLWADSYVNQIWLNANFQLALVNLLRNTPSIPYNSAGYNLIHAACQDPINAAINFGAIRTGVSLSSAQIAEIQLAVGQDVSSTIIQSGYYLQISPASPATRAARQSPPCTLYYTDGQSIQQINLASIEVQ